MLPEAAISKASVLRPDLKAIHTPLVPFDEPLGESRDRNYSNLPARVLEATVLLPKSLHPCFLTGTIFVDDPVKATLLLPKHSRSVSVPVGLSQGSATPLGATVMHSTQLKRAAARAAPKALSANGGSMPAASTAVAAQSNSSGEVHPPQATDSVSINFSVISRHARTFCRSWQSLWCLSVLIIYMRVLYFVIVSPGVQVV